MEQPLPPYGSCNLASINLNHEYFNNLGYFDYVALDEVVSLMVPYLDAVGTANVFPTKEHEQWYKENRPIGIGIMGLADLYLRYKIPYGNEESVLFVKEIMRYIQSASYYESEALGRELGIPKQCQKLPNPRRNITTVSIAPTGSIAIIADCSHGTEPIFSPSFRRIDERGEEYLYIHPQANEDYFVSAIGKNQPSWRNQIDLVAACQKFCDSGVSKTINLPNSATVADVKDAFVYAWRSGLKGITVYRDGSRNFQVLNDVPEEGESTECPSGVCEI